MAYFNATLMYMAYGPPGPLNYGVFFVTLLTYLATVFANVLLMLVIYSDTSLHKPMYIFLFNLSISGLIGSSTVLPNIMNYLLDEMKYVFYSNCLLQVFFIMFYGGCVYGIITVMAYDRFISICKPLQYHLIMTPTKVRLLLGVVYIFSICFLAVQVHLTSSLPLCRYTVNKLYCDNLSVVSLACLKSVLVDLYGLVGIVIFVVFPLLLVIMSYVRILFVSLKASANAKRKALNTCAPHLITFINFSAASLFSAIYNRLSNYFPKELNVFMSIHFVLIPPLLHPFIYGMRTESIRKSFHKVLQKRVLALELNLKSESKNI